MIHHLSLTLVSLDAPSKALHTLTGAGPIRKSNGKPSVPKEDTKTKHCKGLPMPNTVDKARLAKSNQKHSLSLLALFHIISPMINIII